MEVVDDMKLGKGSSKQAGGFRSSRRTWRQEAGSSSMAHRPGLGILVRGRELRTFFAGPGATKRSFASRRDWGVVG